MFFFLTLYMQNVLDYTLLHLKRLSPTCPSPPASSSARPGRLPSSSRASAPGPSSSPARWSPQPACTTCPGSRSTARTSPTCYPASPVPMSIGLGAVVRRRPPPPPTPASRSTRPVSLPAWSTPPYNSAPHSDWRPSPPSPPSRTSQVLTAGAAPAQALTAGFGRALLVSALCPCVAAGAIALRRLQHPWRTRRHTRTPSKTWNPPARPRLTQNNEIARVCGADRGEPNSAARSRFRPRSGGGQRQRAAHQSRRKLRLPDCARRILSAARARPSCLGDPLC